MTISQLLDAWPPERIRELYAAVAKETVESALAREQRDVGDLIALLSPQAAPALEAMARKANQSTRRQFGRTVSLYAPIYLSNVCAADCAYCGFSACADTPKKRVTLNFKEIERECEALADMGYDSVLLLTGDAPAAAPVAYIAEACAIARRWFSAVAVEVYSMERDEYALLCDKGLDGVTVYMETYAPDVYAAMHRFGRKKDYRFRLESVERAADAGVRRISIGVLLGLYDWRIDAVWLALHARHLQKHCWQSALSISFPRLRNAPSTFKTPHPVSDAELVQMMLALRLFLPEAGFNLSTRERPEFRDKLLPLGITSMSAGSSTRPGGYAAAAASETLEQFETEDQRTPAQVADMIRRAGYDPVWKDFDRVFIECR